MIPKTHPRDMSALRFPRYTPRGPEWENGNGGSNLCPGAGGADPACRPDATEDR